MFKHFWFFVEKIASPFVGKISEKMNISVI